MLLLLSLAADQEVDAPPPVGERHEELRGDVDEEQVLAHERCACAIDEDSQEVRMRVRHKELRGDVDE